MKSWVRITFATFVLIGGTIFFGHWALLQFDYIFDNMSGFYVANTASVPLSIGINERYVQSTSTEVIASSTKINNEKIASTSLEVASSSTSVVYNSNISTTSPEISATSATSTDLNLLFTFPKKADELYIGCTYQISWQASTTVDSLNLVLMDAGTGKISAPVTSGLAKENKIKTDVQSLSWKVGKVWPGGYYIKVSKINSTEADFKSKVFEIKKMSTNISTDERAKICKGSDGAL